MCSINRIVAVFVLIASSGLLSQQLGALVAERYVAGCEVVDEACR